MSQLRTRALQQSASLFDHFVSGDEQIDGSPMDYVLRGNTNMVEHKAEPDLRLCCSLDGREKRLLVPLFGWTARRGAT
jgi:hypothetical protein